MDYKTSGVNVEAGRSFVNQIKSNVQATYRKEVIGGLGGFGGFTRLPEGLKSPVLVAGTDGVGTKLELAQKYQAHFGVGIDLVAMCINDVITSGAEPLFFLDYIATGILSPAAMGQVIEGIAKGCRLSGCSLLGGETAEMPGFYMPGQYDLAGFCVGVAEEAALIDGSNVCEGDRIIGIGSSGVHSNGFSLVRKVLDLKKVDQTTQYGKDQVSVINTLLEPTKLYGELVKSLLGAKVEVKAMAHITGGGLPENLPRCLPTGLRAFVDVKAWSRPEIFTWLQEAGEIPEVDLWNTFNLGIGFCAVVSEFEEKRFLEVSSNTGFDAWTIGVVEAHTDKDQQLVKGLPSS